MQIRLFDCNNKFSLSTLENVKTSRIILATVVTLVAGIGLFVPRGFSQAPAPFYQQILSLDGAQPGQPGYSEINVQGPPVFTSTGPDSTAQTDIETTQTLVGNVQTLSGTTTSEVSTTGAAISPTSASTVAQYFVEVDSSVSSSVVLDVVGSLSGSVGTAQGEAKASIGFGDADIQDFDITSGKFNIPQSTLATPTISTNVPHIMELDTSASVFSGLGTVSAEIDPVVLIDPSVPNPEDYTLKFFTTPVPEPNVGIMVVGGLGLLLTFQRVRKRSPWKASL